MRSRVFLALLCALAFGATPLLPALAVAADDSHAPTTKVTLAYYGFSSGTTGFDLNLRHAFASSTAWIGAYKDTETFDQARIGYEFDGRYKSLTYVPSVQAASRGFLGATIYGEFGQRLFALGGAGRTNLRPYWNLGFDPNDYVQFGGGYRDAAGDAISVGAIHDNRLGTGQTNTHVIARHFVRHTWRLTADVVREHGRGDEGLRVRSWAATFDVERPRWFARAAIDPHVNYTPDRQVRVATGVRF